MSSFDEAIKIGKRIKNERRFNGLSQQALADKIENSRDLIARMESGENVGLQNVIAALHVLGLKIQLVNANVVEGNFDKFYAENIGHHLVSELKNNPDPNASGIFKPADKPKMRVANWSKAAKL